MIALEHTHPMTPAERVSVTPGYRPFADAASRLGSPDEPHAFLTRAGFVLYGVLVVAGAGALGEQAPGKERLLAWLIGGFGAAAIVAGVAPKDPPGMSARVAPAFPGTTCVTHARQMQYQGGEN